MRRPLHFAFEVANASPFAPPLSLPFRTAAGLTRRVGRAASTKPGVQLFMVAGGIKKDPAGTLAGLATIGYGYVEAFGMGIQNMAEFKKMAADAGLGCPCGHFGFGFVDRRRRWMTRLRSACATRSAPSCLWLRPKKPTSDELFIHDESPVGRMTSSGWRIQQTDWESARKRGLEFAYHNHNIEFRQVRGWRHRLRRSCSRRPIARW